MSSIRRIPVIPSPRQFQILQYRCFYVKGKAIAFTRPKGYGLQVHGPAVQVAVQVYRSEGELVVIEVVAAAQVQLPACRKLQLALEGYALAVGNRISVADRGIDLVCR